MRKRGTAISPWMARKGLCEDMTRELKDPKSDVQTPGPNMPARVHHGPECTPEAGGTENRVSG